MTIVITQPIVQNFSNISCHIYGNAIMADHYVVRSMLLNFARFSIECFATIDLDLVRFSCIDTFYFGFSSD